MIEKKLFNKKNTNLFLLLLLVLVLPVAHVTSIQNITLGLFSLITLTMITKENIKKFITFKIFLISYFTLFVLALISIQYSINAYETIDEIRGELIKPFIILIFLYIYTYEIDLKKIWYIFFIICFALFFHTLLNILVWIYNGGWPVRTGGFLDGSIGTKLAAGERFGIYVTYSLAISISLFFTKYKKFAFIFLILSLISIVANNTRATYIGMLFVFLSYFLFMYKNKLLKYALLVVFVISIVSFIFYSKNLHTRFNAYNMLTQIEYLAKYSPSEYDRLVKEHNLGFSAISRLAMWKSVLLYRAEDPFTPRGYGRFLYGKEIKKLWENSPQNIPFAVFPQLHSDFMSILFSLGVLGLLAFVTMLGYFFKISHYIYEHSENYKFIGIFLFLGISGHIASMLFGSFFGDSEQIYFYILYSFALVLYLKTKEKNSETAKTYSSK